jgi:hypothetical protein
MFVCLYVYEVIWKSSFAALRVKIISCTAEQNMSVVRKCSYCGNDTQLQRNHPQILVFIFIDCILLCVQAELQNKNNIQQ